MALFLVYLECTASLPTLLGGERSETCEGLTGGVAMLLALHETYVQHPVNIPPYPYTGETYLTDVDAESAVPVLISSPRTHPSRPP